MADIAFLLIVFFVVTTVRTLDRTKVDLPGSKIRTPAGQEAAMIVLASGTRSGSNLVYKFSDGTAQTFVVPGPEAIEAHAATAVAENPARVFEIKADGDVPCEQVGRVLDALIRGGGRKVLMLTEPLDSRESTEGAP
jgi:biopolymer transport protein ExbD